MYTEAQLEILLRLQDDTSFWCETYSHLCFFKLQKVSTFDYRISAVLSNGPGGPGAPKHQGAPKQPMH